jgi:hypothetical protein
MRLCGIDHETWSFLGGIIGKTDRAWRKYWLYPIAERSAVYSHSKNSERERLTMTRSLLPLLTVAATILAVGSMMSMSAFASDTTVKPRPGIEQQTACAISPARGPLGY